MTATLRLLVVPFGKPGETSSGRITVTAGGISCPEDLSRVKLLVEHDRGEPIGVAVAAEETDAGLEVTFTTGPATLRAVKEALAGVRNGLRDGASPGIDFDEATLLRLRRAGPGVSVAAAGMLREVSLVAIGGFVDARVLEVTA